MCRSVDNVDAGGFALVADGAGLVADDGVAIFGAELADAAGLTELGVVGFVASGFLENIVCSLHFI
jgi:hypothetical protein